jgi:uncharacterized DUF497 family protein
MKFTWDENKNTIDRAKHGIGFETAKLVFNDHLHISIQDLYEMVKNAGKHSVL